MAISHSHNKTPETFMGYESFASLKEFREVLNQYQRDTGTAFVVRASKSAASYTRHTGRPLPSSVEYYRVQYVCIHNGKRAKETADKRRFADHNCQATVGLLLDLNTMRMRVNRVCLRHSHETFQDFPEVYSKNRRLTEEQMDDVFRLIDGFYSVDEVRNYISTNYNLAVTRYDVRNLRTKRQTRIKEITQLLSEINAAILQLGSKRCKSEMEKLYAYRNELRNTVKFSELNSDNLAPVEPIVSSKADQTETVPSIVQVASVPSTSAQLTNMSSTSVQLTSVSCESPLSAIQVPSETVQATNSIASVQLEDISSNAQLTSISSSIQLASMPSNVHLAGSTSDQLVILPSSAQMVILPSAVQLAGISSTNDQYLLMPSTSNQLVLIPATSEVMSTLSTSDQLELMSSSAYMESTLPTSDQMELASSSNEIKVSLPHNSDPLEIMPSSTEVVTTATLPASDTQEIMPTSTYIDSTPSYASDQSMSPPKITVNLRDRSRRIRRLPYRFTE